jgi:hypothetical protein
MANAMWVRGTYRPTEVPAGHGSTPENGQVCALAGQVLWLA